MTRTLTIVFALLAQAPVAFADDNPRPSPLQARVKKLWDDALLQAKDGKPTSEPARMADLLLKGSKMGAGLGWFDPGQGRHDWKWLAGRFDTDQDGKISPAELNTAPDLFRRLDRDRSGFVTAADLDWSEKSEFVKQQRQATALFRAMDTDGNGQLTAKEWAAFFDRLADEKGHLSADDLRQALFPPQREKGKNQKQTEAMLQAFLRGDVGSPFEGPRVGKLAPDFSLPPLARRAGDGPERDPIAGAKKITLSDYRGKKPVVLIFGSFT